VTVDLAAIGGSAVAALFDDGTNGDVTAGDGIYSLSYTLPAAAAVGVYPLTFTTSDAQARSTTAFASLELRAALNAEAEPNETKSQATLAAGGGAGMASGDTITGTTTGFGTASSGPASVDTFRIRTIARPLGIYRHRLSLLSSTVGHTATIRGLSQNFSFSGVPGVINTTSDVAAQTASTTFPGAAANARVSQWYGFGRQEEIYYRITGNNVTTAAYTATLDTQPVTPTVVAGDFAAGPITIDPGPLNTADTDFWVYDSNFNPIPGFGIDDRNTLNSLTRTLTPGTYYVAWSTGNLANDQPCPPEETSRTGTVMDFPNSVLNSSTTSQSNLDLRITASNIAVTVNYTRSQFEVQWAQFTVQPSTPPSAVVAVNPAVVTIGVPTLLTAVVTPGTPPSSSGITVTVNLAAIGGSAVAQLLDDGTNGDVTAGDGIYSLSYTLPVATAFGVYPLTFTTSDSPARSTTALASLEVRAAVNAETEPNDSKALATPAAGSGAGMASGDTITGTTTGTSTTVPGPASADTFRIKTIARPLGIYRHRLSLLNSNSGNVATIRGLSQSSSPTGTTGVINTTSDVAAQAASTNFPAAVGMLTSQWYGFGRQEEIYYRVTGSSLTPSAYIATLDTRPVTPTVVAGAFAAGPITIDRGPLNTADTDFWVYDANFNPIPGFGIDDPNTLIRTLNPGTYFVAWSTFNLANDQPCPPEETSRTGTVMDFPNSVLNSSTLSQNNLDLRITAVNTSATVNLSRSQFEVRWVRFTVEALPTAPSAVVAVNPSVVVAGSPALLTANVTPGTLPTSSGITVTVDLAAVGGSAAAALFDDGTNGDVTAGDGIYSLSYTLPAATTGSVYPLTFTTSDAQARSTSRVANLDVRAIPTAINLGTISESNPTLTDSRAMAAGQILWYTFTVPAGGEASATRYIDMHTFGNTITGNDTHIGLYRADGTIVTGVSGIVTAVNDDWQAALSGQIGRPSMLTFGQASPGRVYVTDTTPAFTPADGRNGTLTAGTYYLAVSGFSTTFGATTFNATTTHTRTGTSVVTILTNPPGSAACNIADIVEVGGLPPADGILTGDDFNAYIGAFAADNLLADVVAVGGMPPGDGLITGDDFIAFISAFAAGCP